MRAERATGVITHHGEGPGWHRAEGALKLVDMLAGEVLTLPGELSGKTGPDAVRRQQVGEVAAVWRERTDGGLVVGIERGFALFDASGDRQWRTDVWDDPAIRMNEGGCDPFGRFYSGSMAYDESTGAGTLYRLDPDRSISVVARDLSIPNGLVFSTDAQWAYHADTPTHQIARMSFDAERGEFGPREDFIQIDGNPDGMAMDAEGGFWVALFGGSAVHHYDATGAFVAKVEVGARQVTACAFGGPELDTLYITTSRQGLAPDEDSAAGSVFVLTDPGVRGRPLDLFNG